MCAANILAMLGVVLYEIFPVCLFTTLCRGFDLGKCLLISWRNFFPTFVFTESEKGGLNQHLTLFPDLFLDFLLPSGGLNSSL